MAFGRPPPGRVHDDPEVPPSRGARSRRLAGERGGRTAAPAARRRPPDLAWREFFTDPGLRAVIELALANNRDLRIAALNVEKVQALYRIQRSELYPGVAVAAGPDKSRIPAQTSSTGTAYTVEQDSVLGTASWELDLFGRLRSLKAGALDQYLATVEGAAGGPDLARGRRRRRLPDSSRPTASPSTWPGDPGDPEILLRPDPAEPGCRRGLRPDASPVPEPGRSRPGRRRPLHRSRGHGQERPGSPGRDAGPGRSPARTAGLGRRAEGRLGRPGFGDPPSAGPTSWRPSTSSRAPTPTSERPGPPSSRASR